MSKHDETEKLIDQKITTNQFAILQSIGLESQYRESLRRMLTSTPEQHDEETQRHFRFLDESGIQRVFNCGISFVPRPIPSHLREVVGEISDERVQKEADSTGPITIAISANPNDWSVVQTASEDTDDEDESIPDPFLVNMAKERVEMRSTMQGRLAIWLQDRLASASYYVGITIGGLSLDLGRAFPGNDVFIDFEEIDMLITHACSEKLCEWKSYRVAYEDPNFFAELLDALARCGFPVKLSAALQTQRQREP